MNYKEIKVLTTPEDVNQHLSKGWKIIKIFSVNQFVVGFPREL